MNGGSSVMNSTAEWTTAVDEVVEDLLSAGGLKAPPVDAQEDAAKAEQGLQIDWGALDNP